MTLKPCPLSIKYETFLRENHAENVHQKLVSDSFFILVTNPKQVSMQEILLKIKYFKRKLSKIFKIFFSPFNGQGYQKQKGPRTSDQSLFGLRNKFKKFLY